MFNKKVLFILTGVGALIGLVLNSIFFPMGKVGKAPAPALTGQEGSPAIPIISLPDQSEKRVGAIFRNSGQKEADSVLISEITEKGNPEDLTSFGWSLVGALSTSHGSKAFLVSEAGLVREVSISDRFGDGNEVTQIKSDELTFLKKDGGYDKLRLYREAFDE